jgi:hypothetical protein
MRNFKNFKDYALIRDILAECNKYTDLDIETKIQYIKLELGENLFNKYKITIIKVLSEQLTN